MSIWESQIGMNQLAETSIKRPKRSRVSFSAVKCYPCREVTLNYNRSFLFHGGDTGSIPVRDTNFPKQCQDFTRTLDP